MQSEKEAHAKRIQELQKEDKDKDNDNNDNEPSRKKARSLKHLGPGFGKHSTKTRPEVQAELTTPKKKVQQKTTPKELRRTASDYISSESDQILDSRMMTFMHISVLTH